ncbi:MAG: hypothetical protein GXO71_06430, partial [Caldiserica bacterium]|nr:hypothetical protein [Caldisericota bacterium]
EVSPLSRVKKVKKSKRRKSTAKKIIFFFILTYQLPGKNFQIPRPPDI